MNSYFVFKHLILHLSLIPFVNVSNGIIFCFYSARIWEIDSQEVVGPVLFGHSVRVWDCCISDSVCTLNVFDLLYNFLKDSAFI